MKPFMNTQVNTNKTLVSIFVATSLLLTPSYSFAKNVEKAPQTIEQTHKEEIGFGIGALIGGLLGGPAGAFITGLAGSLIAKEDNAKENIDQLTVALTKQKQANNQTVMKFQQKIQNIEQNYQKELLALEQNYQQAGQLQAENLLMSLQFSTGSSAIAPIYQGQIQALANLLQQSPQLMIDLSGYTDLQGSEALNQVLSQARVNAVKTALVKYGIDDQRIKTQAFGETATVVAKGNNEASFYDRRVVIQLHSNNNQTAKN